MDNDIIGVMQLLKGLGGGRVLEDLDRRLHELIAAVRQSRKRGRVALTINVRPTKDPELLQLEIQGDVSAKVPHVERVSHIIYVTDDNELSARNPRQPKPPPNTIAMPNASGRDLDGQSLAAGERE